MYECNLQSPSQPTDFPIPVTLNCYPLQWIWDKNNPTKKWQRIIHYKRVHIKWPSKEKLTNSNMCEQERVSTSLMEPTTLTVGNMWHFSASFAKFLSIVLLWCFFFQFGINDSCHSFHVSFFILSTFSFFLNWRIVCGRTFCSKFNFHVISSLGCVFCAFVNILFTFSLHIKFLFLFLFFPFSLLYRHFHFSPFNCLKLWRNFFFSAFKIKWKKNVWLRRDDSVF